MCSILQPCDFNRCLNQLGEEDDFKWFQSKEERINCIGPYKLVGECKEDIEGVVESSYIINATWQANTKMNRRKRICSEHRKFFGKKFKEKTSGRYSKCRYCEHMSDMKDKDIRPMHYDLSEALRKRGGKYVPVSCSICGACRKRLITWKDQQAEPCEDAEPTSDDPMPSSQGSNSSATTVYPPNDPTDDSMDEDFDEEDYTSQMPKTVRLVNKFLEEHGQKSKIESQLHQPWRNADDSRKRKILDVAADMSQITVNALTPKVENQLEILHELTKMKKIEKQIDPNRQHVSSFLKDIVLTWNAGDREARRQAIAMGSRVLSFSQMDECNPPREKNALRRAVREAHGQATSSTDSDSENDGKLGGVYFSPPLTKWFYRESNFHRLRNGHGLAPAKRRGYNVHRVSPAMLSAIYSFITSNEVTKATAYGKL